MGDGRYVVTVTARDGRGGSAAGSFILRVSNPVPVANDDAFTTPYLTVLHGSVAGNDSDPDGDPLSFSVLVGPSHGSLILSPNGQFSYNPSVGFSGLDSFTYRVTDQDGASASARVRITVVPIPAQLQDDFFFVPRSRVLPVVNLLANDVSYMGALRLLEVRGLLGSVPLLEENGAFQYVPINGFHGTEVGSYTVADVDGTLHTARITLVTPAPVLRSTRYTDFPFASGLVPGEYSVSAVEYDTRLFGDFTVRARPDGVLLTTFELISDIREDEFVLVYLNDEMGRSFRVHLAFAPFQLTAVPVENGEANRGDPVLNPQTSLYEQTVRIHNPIDQPLTHFRITLSELPLGVIPQGFEAGEGTGWWFRDFHMTVPASGSTDVVLEYWSPRVQPFRGPSFHPSVPTFRSVPNLDGDGITARVFVGYAGHIYLEFMTRPQARYQIRFYDSSSGRWISSTGLVDGTGFLYHWRDTEFANMNPSDPVRLFQVIEVK